MSLDRTDSAVSGASKFPPVYLDTTFYDLFTAEDKAAANDTLCSAKPNSDLSYGNTVPVNNKYIIHSAQVATASDLAHLQLDITSYLLLFYAGPMKVVFLGAEGKTDDGTLRKDIVDANAQRSFNVINEAQRPRITSYANHEEFIKKHDGSNVRWAFAQDFAEQLPCVNHPDVVYLINSKRWLGVCDLKSANDRIIDCAIQCPHHMTKDNLWYYGGKDCRECADGIEGEVKRIKEILSKPAPYVLKLTQSLSSVGTMIAKDEDAKGKILDTIDEYLHSYLPRITKENAYLLTTALILSDFIPGETMALNFFVRKDGSVIYLGACHQRSTGESGRQATAITFADQEKYQKKYQNILDQIGQALHGEGYYGPGGCDIMEDPDDGTLFAIDLNIRSALSMVLYTLRGHLNKQRGFKMSIVYECIMLKIPRDELEEKFNKEFQEGKIILLGSTKLGDKDQWAYGVVVAGGDQKEIDQISDAILEFEIEGGQGGDVADAAA